MLCFHFQYSVHLQQPSLSGASRGPAVCRSDGAQVEKGKAHYHLSPSSGSPSQEGHPENLWAPSGFETPASSFSPLPRPSACPRFWSGRSAASTPQVPAAFQHSPLHSPVGRSGSPSRSPALRSRASFSCGVAAAFSLPWWRGGPPPASLRRTRQPSAGPDPAPCPPAPPRPALWRPRDRSPRRPWPHPLCVYLSLARAGPASCEPGPRPLTSRTGSLSVPRRLLPAGLGAAGSSPRVGPHRSLAPPRPASLPAGVAPARARPRKRTRRVP